MRGIASHVSPSPAYAEIEASDNVPQPRHRQRKLTGD